MHLDLQEWVQRDIFVFGSSEMKTSELFGQLLRTGDAYVDVGAHVGLFTLIARHHIGPSGMVMAIEPQPYGAAKILDNWQCNGFENLRLYVAAVGKVDRRVQLHDQSEVDRSQLTLAGPGIHDRPLTYEVPLARLDTLLSARDIDAIRLLKIDVEGYESEVLEGLGRKAQVVENIVMEVHPVHYSADALRILKDYGFTRWRTVVGKAWKIGDELPEYNLWAAREL